MVYGKLQTFYIIFDIYTGSDPEKKTIQRNNNKIIR